MKPQLPHPEDPKEFALWLDKQDAIADAQIAAKQWRPLKHALSKTKTYA
jgi:hypothetical protein